MLEVRHGFTGGIAISGADSYPQPQCVCFRIPHVITAPEAEPRAANFPWSHQKPSTKRTAMVGQGRDCVLPPYHARAHPSKYDPVPISGLHLPVLKAILIIYCPSKEEPQIFQLHLVIQGSSTLLLSQLWHNPLYFLIQMFKEIE